MRVRALDISSVKGLDPRGPARRRRRPRCCYAIDAGSRDLRWGYHPGTGKRSQHCHAIGQKSEHRSCRQIRYRRVRRENHMRTVVGIELGWDHGQHACCNAACSREANHRRAKFDLNRRCTIPIPKNSKPPRANANDADCGGIEPHTRSPALRQRRADQGIFAPPGRQSPSPDRRPPLGPEPEVRSLCQWSDRRTLLRADEDIRDKNREDSQLSAQFAAHASDNPDSTCLCAISGPKIALAKTGTRDAITGKEVQVSGSDAEHALCQFARCTISSDATAQPLNHSPFARLGCNLRM
jgi:hypothetical protein